MARLGITPTVVCLFVSAAVLRTEWKTTQPHEYRSSKHCPISWYEGDSLGSDRRPLANCGVQETDISTEPVVHGRSRRRCELFRAGSLTARSQKLRVALRSLLDFGPPPELEI